MQEDKRFPDNTSSLEEYFQEHPEQDVSNAALMAEEVAEAEAPVAEAEAAPLEAITFDPKKRVGIHYFADDNHYNQADTQRWLPILQTLGANWITLPAPTDRAIPSEFISALIDADIQPVIQLALPLTETHSADSFAPIFKAYANWGVRYIVLFDRPNLRSQWPGMAWTQRGLVRRFLDAFIPLAKAAMDAGLHPVFPGLEPGGDYWDTAFLRSALESLAERGETALLESLVIGAYAWTGDKSMTWGAGGPEAWPATLPYHTPAGSEDQRGFRIFDWYNTISRAAIGKVLPIILIAAGVQRESTKAIDAQTATRAIRMTETLMREPSDEKNNAVPANVLACNYWLLSSEAGSPVAHAAWYKINGKPTKVGEEWLEWKYPASESGKPAKTATPIQPKTVSQGVIGHYLLLPSAQTWPMQIVRTFLQDHQATVGTSETDAAHAARVTLAGGLDAFSDELIRSLIESGCTLDYLSAQA